jgi:lipoate-protein ligase A
VPFPFDVHGLVFSDDAVSLEHDLHTIFNNQRVNKVNLRKEFFKVSLDDIEKVVDERCPSAEFKRTALAEQYRQSISMSETAAELDDEDLSENFA